MVERRVALYRLYNCDKWPLYIGISDNPLRRFGQHYENMRGKEDELLYPGFWSNWVPDVHSIDMVWFPNRTLAEAAEMVAIQTEKPLYNAKHVLGWELEQPMYGIRLLGRPELEDGWYTGYAGAAIAFHSFKEIFGAEVDMFVAPDRPNKQNLKRHRLACAI